MAYHSFPAKIIPEGQTKILQRCRHCGARVYSYRGSGRLYIDKRPCTKGNQKKTLAEIILRDKIRRKERQIEKQIQKLRVLKDQFFKLTQK